MRDRLRMRYIGLGFALAVGVWGVPAIAGADASRDVSAISGSWRLNDELSDDPVRKLREAGDRGVGPGRAGGAGRAGGGMGRRGGAGPGVGGVGRGAPGERAGMGSRGGSDREANRERLRAVREGARKIAIVQDGPSLVVRYADGRERLLFTDGREFFDSVEPGRRLEARARWKKGGRLLVTGKDERGRKFRQDFRIDDDGGRLRIETRLAALDSAPAIVYTRYYDPDPAPAEISVPAVTR